MEDQVIFRQKRQALILGQARCLNLPIKSQPSVHMTYRQILMERMYPYTEVEVAMKERGHCFFLMTLTWHKITRRVMVRQLWKLQ